MTPKGVFNRNELRTDFFLQNIYPYLLMYRYPFYSIPPSNKTEEQLLARLKKTISNFLSEHRSDIRSYCEKHVKTVSKDTIAKFIVGVGNLMFTEEDITWPLIITFFSFVGEFLLMCLSNGMPEYVIDIVYESFSNFMIGELERWIFDHGGWKDCIESIVIFDDSIKFIK